MKNKYHTFWKRLGAGLIDGLIFVPLSLIGDLFDKANHPTIFIGWTLVNTICWTTYVVVGHGKYGQTIGKWLMHIKVLDFNEKNTIGYTRAFYRELIWILVDITGILYFGWLLYKDSTINKLIIESVDDFLGLLTLGWLIIELITMLFNSKRRALHDYIADSVVIDLDEMKREELKERKNELMQSLHSESDNG